MTIGVGILLGIGLHVDVERAGDLALGNRFDDDRRARRCQKAARFEMLEKPMISITKKTALDHGGSVPTRWRGSSMIFFELIELQLLR